MAEDTATLKDTVVSDEPVATTTDSTTSAASVAAPTIADNSEAAEIGQILLNSGYTKNQVNELIEAPGALAALRYAVENNPTEFLTMLERTNPQVAEKFLGAMADTYVTRYQPKAEAKATGKDASSELMEEVAGLRERLNRAEGEQARRDANAALAATQERYKSRVDDLFGQTKDLNLTKSETKALRASLDSELSKDPNVVARCSKGNFVDVAPTFKKILDEWSSDKKAAADSEKTAREKQSKGAFAEFQSGPNPLSVTIPDATFDSWDNTESGFAKALEQFAQ